MARKVDNKTWFRPGTKVLLKGIHSPYLTKEEGCEGTVCRDLHSGNQMVKIPGNNDGAGPNRKWILYPDKMNSDPNYVTVLSFPAPKAKKPKKVKVIVDSKSPSADNLTVLLDLAKEVERTKAQYEAALEAFKQAAKRV